ncbi:MAG: DUF1289 domain-containing protein [Kangiellaceae bacterium]|nr:DUF1289 domain-containing protein [Kangiellaceae bacterium]
MKKNSIGDSAKIIRSPCISNCCLDQDDICLGCYRHIDEITGWHSADSTGKLKILENTKARRKQAKYQRSTQSSD